MIELSAAAVDVLRRSSATGDAIFLPGDRLDRKLYVEVDKAITSIGGKWDRRRKAHLFDYSPLEALCAIVGAGARPDINPLDFFATPPHIADYVVSRLAGMNMVTALEPSAGTGSLIEALIRYGASTITAVEADPKRVKKIIEGPIVPGVLVYVHEADFLTYTDTTIYDAVAMNPPFTAKTDPLVYIKHITRAFDMVRDGGRLVSVVPQGAVYRTDKRTQAFRENVHVFGGFEDMPAESFKESGTNVNTMLVVLDQNSRLEWLE